jgi:superfamily II DNA or RNA helicase
MTEAFLPALRKYQERALSFLHLLGVNVLVVAPNGGKTLCALTWILRNPDFKRVLILTHGTELLRAQWRRVCEKYGVSYTDSAMHKWNRDCRIVIDLPQSVSRRDLDDFDLVIVDEAHERYLKKQCQEILTRVSPRCQLLLTGTPSKFIRNEENNIYNIVVISAYEIYMEGKEIGEYYFADTYCAIVESDYAIGWEDRDADWDVKKSYKDTEENTHNSFVSLIMAMCARLSQSELIKDNLNLINSTTYFSDSTPSLIFSRLKKTLIASRNQAQARMIGHELEKYDISFLISTEDTDVDSKNIVRFLNDPEIQVLVVVRRGILGFDFPELVNVVDFTGSWNIDRIYQLYARVLRNKNIFKNDTKKYFFRLAIKNNSALDSIFLQLALSMIHPDFIRLYDGKNHPKLPVLLPKRFSNAVNQIRRGQKNKGRSQERVYVDPISANEILSLRLLEDHIINSKNPAWKETKYAKFGQVVEKLTGARFRRGTKKVSRKGEKRRALFAGISNLELVARSVKVTKETAARSFGTNKENLNAELESRGIPCFCGMWGNSRSGWRMSGKEFRAKLTGDGVRDGFDATGNSGLNYTSKDQETLDKIFKPSLAEALYDSYMEDVDD